MENSKIDINIKTNFVDKNIIYVSLDQSEVYLGFVTDFLLVFVKHHDVADYELVIVNAEEGGETIQTNLLYREGFYNKFKRVWIITSSTTANIYSEYGNNVIPIMYPYGLLNRTIKRFKHQNLDSLADIKPTKKFVCLNNKAKIERAYFLGNLITDNIDVNYSWLACDYDDLSSSDMLAEKFPNIDFNEKVFLDVETVSNSNQDIVFDKYAEALIDISPETNATYNSRTVYSEKTWKPILLKKPYFGIATMGYYEWLRDHGFELYDELFDYSFDGIENNYERYDAQLSEIRRINDLEFEELMELMRQIEPKLEYNKQHALKEKAVPEIIYKFRDRFTCFNNGINYGYDNK